MSAAPTKREVSENRAALEADRLKVVHRYRIEGAYLATLCQEYGVGIEWLRRQFDEWNVPRRLGRCEDPGFPSEPLHEVERAILARRLANPGLLEASVVIDLSAAHPICSVPVTRLALPVGRGRVAGHLEVANWAEACLVILQLRSLPAQFPALRQRKPYNSPTAPRTVCWGASTPQDTHQQGQMLGYHRAGVLAYATFGHLLTDTSNAPSDSP
ncbi:DUF6302 family protein [Streptomyces sp. NPDC086783]|uniref:DUF6302 family protein n=1 Tax=Streptomyces sp. NPDC086783 TaxID=3365758 RepID=UPI00380A3A4E